MTDLAPDAGWYTAEEIGDGLTLIREPHVSPLLAANTWHLTGRDRDVLIDCGLGVVPLRDALPELLGEREPTVVLTHAHLDHMGAAWEFQDCWAHPAEPVDLPGRGSLHTRTLARILGLPEPTPEDEATDPEGQWLLSSLPTPAYDPIGYVLRPVTPTRALRGGDVVDLGDRRLEVVHLPGHTPGSIALYERDTRTLFTGDVIYDDVLLDSLYESDPTLYAHSMRTLLTMDVQTVHAGHDVSFGADRLAQLAEAYLSSKELS